MTRRGQNDPNQQELCFEDRIEALCATTIAVHAEVNSPPEPVIPDESVESELELRVEIAGACKRAIRESGFSREQVLDRINALFGRTDADQADDAAALQDGKKPMSLHMFNAYLSKPHEYQIQPWLLLGICRVTNSLAPLEPLVSPLGARIVSAEETLELFLGKLERGQREMQQVKRDLQRQMAARSAE